MWGQYNGHNYIKLFNSSICPTFPIGKPVPGKGLTLVVIETVESDKAEQVSENLYAAVYSIIVYWHHDQQIMNIASSVATTATHLQVHAGQDQKVI